MTGPVAWARFDDLVAGAALRFPAAQRVLVARRAQDVVPVLEELEAAVAGDPLDLYADLASSAGGCSRATASPSAS